MAYQATILSQIIREVNRYDFKKQVSKYNGDHKVSKLSCFNILVAMIFTHLKSNKTLRDIAIGFATAFASLYHIGIKSMKRSTLSDALRNRPARVYEDFYYGILASLNRSEKRQLGMKLHLIDSTTISMCLAKFEWAKYRKKKGGIKLHVMLDGETKLAEQVLFTNAVCHDMNAIKEAIDFKKNEIYVYDRGYACYNYLYQIELAGAFFVTRRKSNWKIEVIKNKRKKKSAGIMADQVIGVAGVKRKEYPVPLRLVKFYHSESKKVLEFLTNNFRLSAKKIADIYKKRWQIELFFKWMKQHLKVKTFLSTSENGVKIQIWCALITYVLLHIVKSRLVCDIDVFEIYRKVQDHLFSKRDMYDLLTRDLSKKQEEKSCQPELLYA
jgi:Transposase DDE domain/Domain of unknown function (DUF4372)